MGIKKIPDSVRYTMTHGEMLPANKAGKTLSLKMVVFTLQSKEDVEVLNDMKNKSLSLPEGAKIEVSYQKAAQNTSIEENRFDNLNSDEVQELKYAMNAASRSARPVISYTNNKVKNGQPARMVVAFSFGVWECMTANNITYAEANYIYEKLVSYGLCT
ncbi:hypothetical protein IJH10_01980 [Candidatus Saccharibacteria bacterium]|nr:hypothetical protein [Candidatus Saccharibacteria bacterium]